MSDLQVKDEARTEAGTTTAKELGKEPARLPKPPKHNYQRDLEYVLHGLQKRGVVPTLLLHACCAPCSSYCIEYLSQFFKITVFYYNPNISPDEEYRHRVAEIKRFVSEFKTKYPVTLIEGPYEPKKFYEFVRGLENEPEGGKRCRKCFELRLSESARIAKELCADFVTTTLTISPMKDAQVLNDVMEEQCKIYGVKRLPTDFKKKGGFVRSTELSAQYGLYRQNYCGCIFSQREAKEREARAAAQASGIEAKASENANSAADNTDCTDCAVYAAKNADIAADIAAEASL